MLISLKSVTIIRLNFGHQEVLTKLYGVTFFYLLQLIDYIYYTSLILF